MAAEAEHEVGDGEHLLLQRSGGGTGGTGEHAGVVIHAVFGVEVLDLGVDHLILDAGLQGVAADKVRVIDLGIDDQRILVLRVTRLASELAQSAIHVEGVEAAGEVLVRGQSGDVVDAGIDVEVNGALAAIGEADADAHFQHGVGPDAPGGAGRDLQLRA